jgi:hypothetical protein
LECFLNASDGVATQRGSSDEAQAMDPKLAILFMLIGTVIGLSHLSDAKLGRMRRQLIRLRWRDFGPGRRKS